MTLLVPHIGNSLRYARLLPILLSIIVLVQCNLDDGVNYKPTSAGRLDEVLWVMDDTLWSGEAGEMVKRQMLKSYEVLPQAEPHYLLRDKTFSQFNNDIIRKYRNIVLVATGDKGSILGDYVRRTFPAQFEENVPVDSIRSFMLRNVWAKPQIVMVVYAANGKSLLGHFEEQVRRIEQRIRHEENGRVLTLLYENGLNQEVVDYIREYFELGIDIPKDYFAAKRNSDYTWLRRETAELSSNIMLYKLVLTDEQLTAGVDWKQYVKDIRNFLGKEHISSTVEGSYMEIEDRFAPVLQDSLYLDSLPVLRTRGLWRIENDFMGGPFLNYAWLEPGSGTLYMLDGFVHAPKAGKKKYMRELENIFSTLQP